MAGKKPETGSFSMAACMNMYVPVKPSTGMFPPLGCKLVIQPHAAALHYFVLENEKTLDQKVSIYQKLHYLSHR